MKASYEDIIRRIKESPLWWDSDGVPRYDSFTPRMCPNIYAEEILLIEIACQFCNARFRVEQHWSKMVALWTYKRKIPKFSDQGELSRIHYGDPPIHDCIGDTMNCWNLRVIQFWRHDDSHNLVRDHDLEMPLPDGRYEIVKIHQEKP